MKTHHQGNAQGVCYRCDLHAAMAIVGENDVRFDIRKGGLQRPLDVPLPASRRGNQSGPPPQRCQQTMGAEGPRRVDFHQPVPGPVLRRAAFQGHNGRIQTRIGETDGGVVNEGLGGTNEDGCVDCQAQADSLDKRRRTRNLRPAGPEHSMWPPRERRYGREVGHNLAFARPTATGRGAKIGVFRTGRRFPRGGVLTS